MCPFASKEVSRPSSPRTAVRGLRVRLPIPNPGAFFFVIEYIVVHIQLMAPIAHFDLFPALGPELPFPAFILCLEGRMLLTEAHPEPWLCTGRQLRKKV